MLVLPETHESIKTEGLCLIERIWEHQLENREIIISGLIDEDLIEKAVIQIFNFNRIDEAFENDEQVQKVLKENNQIYEREPIKIYINTLGGDGDSAMSLVSAIRSSKTPIHTYALGRAFSAGFLILIAGHKRYAQEFSRLMFHQPAYDIKETAKAQDIYDLGDITKVYYDKIINYIVSVTKIKKSVLTKNIRLKRDLYMFCDEAMKLGIIDEII